MLILTLLDPQQHTPIKQWRFEQESLIRIGRALDNHVVLTDPLVSRKHLELQRIPASGAAPPAQPCWRMVNYSSNGTFLNGSLAAQGILPEAALLQLAQGGPVLQVQFLAAASPPKQPQLPTFSQPSLSVRLRQEAPTCTHTGNLPENLFCIHCGFPVRVEKTIRHYQVLRILGRGGMGTTYLAWQRSESNSPAGRPQGTLLALKEMNADIARIPKAQELFEREATILKTLNHPGIPRFYDFFLEANRKYLVMELIHGSDLDKRVRQQGPVSVEQAIPWMLQVCAVLEYLHNRETPIIHRDIKPGNLLLQAVTNRIVVLDFGAVKEVGMLSGTRIGAEGYSAPEQTLGRPVPQSDLYAIGASLIFLLTGESPLRFYKKQNQDYRFALEEISTIAPRLRHVLEKATQLRPGDRYQTARELARALEGI
jgi:serine/threonine-protein kinase